jgi:hypothetical protein
MNVEQGFLIADLVEVLQTLPKRDHIFAGKMIKTYDYLGKLSPKQETIVRGILAKAVVA